MHVEPAFTGHREIRLRAVAGDRASFRSELLYGDATVDLEVRPTGTIEAIGNVPTDGLVVLEHIDAANVRMLPRSSLSNGALMFERVPYGDYVVRVFTHEMNLAVQPVTALPGATVPMTLAP